MAPASGFTISAPLKFGEVRGRGGAPRAIKSQIPPIVEETRYGREGGPTLRDDAAQSQSSGSWPFSATNWKAEYLRGPRGPKAYHNCMTISFVAKKDPRLYEPGAATWATVLQHGQKPTSALRATWLLLPVRPRAQLCWPPTRDKEYPSAPLPKGHLAGLVGLHEVPQLSVGGGNRGQTYLSVGSQKGKGFARRGRANARRSVGQGH